MAAISNEALKMSHSTLDDFYKGMRQPRYDGSNVLNQLKQLQGGATLQQTVTVTQTQTVEGRPVPPISTGNLHQSQSSFERHVAVSMTEQAASKMFNETHETRHVEQSFGR